MPKLIFNPVSGKFDYIATKSDLDLTGTNSGDVTVTDSSTIDFTLTGQALTGSVIEAGILHNNLSGLQGGKPNEYNHLNNLQLTNLNNQSGTNTGDITVTDTASVDLTLVGQALSATVLPAGVDHGGLGGLTDDDHTQYVLLAGRSGGQTITGGTAINNILTLKTNDKTGNTTTNTSFRILTGDNGNIQALYTTYEGRAFVPQSLSIGLTPAQSGELRLTNDQFIYARNAANTGDVSMIKVNASNNIQFGGSIDLGNQSITGVYAISQFSSSNWQFDENGNGVVGTSLRTPILHGSNIGGGNLTLSSTSNLTKGNILFGNSVFDEANNRLGIGTTSPSSTVDVYAPAGQNPSFSFRDGNMTINDYGTLFIPAVTTDTVGRFANWSIGGFGVSGFAGSASEPGIFLHGYTATSPTQAAIIISGWKPDGTNGRQALSSTEQVLKIRTGLTDLVTFLANGNVGIGTTSPVHKLQVHNGGTTPAASYAHFTNSFTGSTSSDGFSIGVVEDDAYLWNRENTPLYVGTNSTTQMTILGGGNIGIGTTSPGYKLDVLGGGSTLARFVGSASTDALVRIIAANYSTDFDSRLFLGENDTSGMTIEYDGIANIGYIGMNNNVDPTSAWSKRIQMSRTGTEVAFMAGNVGINDTAPSAQLHVDQTSTTAAKPTLRLQQADLSEEFIRFDTTVGTGNAINTSALGTYYGRVRVYVEGVGEKWLALYNT